MPNKNQQPGTRSSHCGLGRVALPAHLLHGTGRSRGLLALGQRGGCSLRQGAGVRAGVCTSCKLMSPHGKDAGTRSVGLGAMPCSAALGRVRYPCVAKKSVRELPGLLRSRPGSAVLSYRWTLPRWASPTWPCSQFWRGVRELPCTRSQSSGNEKKLDLMFLRLLRNALVVMVLQGAN